MKRTTRKPGTEPDRVIQAEELLGPLIKRRGLELRKTGSFSRGGWFVNFENAEFIVQIFHSVSPKPFISIGSRIRPRLRAFPRTPTSMGWLRAFLGGESDSFRFESLEAQAKWLQENDVRLFDSNLLNSDSVKVFIETVSSKKAQRVRGPVRQPKIESDLKRRAVRLLGQVLRTQKLEFRAAERTPMGGWFARLENEEFAVVIEQDRRGDPTGIKVGSRLRPRPRAPVRGPWSMGHLRGFLEGQPDHVRFETSQAEAKWLNENEARLFDSSLLNSEALREWAVCASRRLFGQKPYKRLSR